MFIALQKTNKKRCFMKVKIVDLDCYPSGIFNLVGIMTNRKNKVSYLIRIFVLLGLFSACGTDQTFNELKVVKGWQANIEDFSSFAKIRNSGKQSCGGFFFDPRAYLTGAHCIYLEKQVDVCSFSQFENIIKSSRRGIILQQPILRIRSCKKLNIPSRVANKPLKIKLITSSGSTIIDKVRIDIIDKYYLHFKSDKKIDIGKKLLAVEFSYAPLIRNLRVKGHSPSKVYINPSYQPTSDMSLSPYDMAVLIFPKPITSTTLPLDISGVEIGELVVMMGYGRNEKIGDKSIDAGRIKRKPNKKKLFRVGENTVSDVGDFISLEGAASDSSIFEGSITGKGDSGGPLIKKLTGKVVGLVGGGSLINEKDSLCKTDLDYCKARSSFVDFSRSENIQFLGAIYQKLAVIPLSKYL